MAEVMEEHNCPVCFIRWAAPARLFEVRRQDGKDFFCPNGHTLSYTDTEHDKLRRERDRLKQQAACLEDRIRSAQDNADYERKRRIALSGQVTKMKNRAAAGTCPCCHRTFKQLSAHMTQKHPTFKAEPMDDANVVPFKETSRGE